MLTIEWFLQTRTVRIQFSYKIKEIFRRLHAGAYAGLCTHGPRGINTLRHNDREGLGQCGPSVLEGLFETTGF